VRRRTGAESFACLSIPARDRSWRMNIDFSSIVDVNTHWPICCISIIFSSTRLLFLILLGSQSPVIMALPRVCVLGRSFLSRGSTTRIASYAYHSSRVATATPQREFTSKSWSRQEVVQDQSTSSLSSAPLKDIPEAQRRKNARSVFVTKVPKQATKDQVGAFFKAKGLEPYVFLP
jgi:hypothetical protein